MLFTVRELIEGRSEPVTARSDDPVQHALEKMTAYDFSQLPVVDGDQEPRYTVSSDSILRALDTFGASLSKLHVGDAMVEVPRFSLDADLLQLLDALRNTYAVLAVDSEKRLAGIVTSFDVTEFFRRQTEDSLLVRDVEQMLRDLILAALGVTDGNVENELVQAAIEEITPSKEEKKRQFRKALAHYLKRHTAGANQQPNEEWLRDAFEAAFTDLPGPKKFKDLTLYDFTQLFLQERRWARYGETLKLDRALVRNALDAVRESRNDLFHFRTDLTPKRRTQLRFFRAWLSRVHRPASTLPAAGPQPADATPDEPPRQPQDVPPVGEELGPRESRYAYLAFHLQEVPTGTQSVVLPFHEIEKIIGEPLPSSARQHRAWWANDSTSHAQSREWLDAGWRVAMVDVPGETVEFARSRQREQLYQQFFDRLVERLKEGATFKVTAAPQRHHTWLTVGRLPEGGPSIGLLIVSFARRQRVRVELYITTGNKERNKRILERLRAHEPEIERGVGERLSWEPLQDRIASRVALYRAGQIDAEPREIEAVQGWAVDALNRLVVALRPRLEEAAADSNG